MFTREHLFVSPSESPSESTSNYNQYKTNKKTQKKEQNKTIMMKKKLWWRSIPYLTGY